MRLEVVWKGHGGPLEGWGWGALPQGRWARSRQDNRRLSVSLKCPRARPGRHPGDLAGARGAELSSSRSLLGGTLSVPLLM